MGRRGRRGRRRRRGRRGKKEEKEEKEEKGREEEESTVIQKVTINDYVFLLQASTTCVHNISRRRFLH